MVTRTRFNVTLYVHCLSCFFFIVEWVKVLLFQVAGLYKHINRKCKLLQQIDFFAEVRSLLQCDAL
jgi:hypothetical protein